MVGLSLELMPRASPKSKSTALFKLSGSTQPFDLSKKDKIAKVKSYLFNFPSQLSPIFIHRCTKLSYFFPVVWHLSFHESGGQVLNAALSRQII